MIFLVKFFVDFWEFFLNAVKKICKLIKLIKNKKVMIRRRKICKKEHNMAHKRKN